MQWSWLTKRQWRIGSERFAEAVRECGVLWLVFSLLDKIVDGTLTFPWFVVNFCVSVALWLVGMYIEIQVMEQHE